MVNKHATMQAVSSACSACAGEGQVVGSGDEDGVLACAVTTMLRDEAVVWSGDEVRPKRGAAVRCRQQKGKGAAMAVLQDTAHRMAQERSAGASMRNLGTRGVFAHLCGTSVLLSSLVAERKFNKSHPATQPWHQQLLYKQACASQEQRRLEEGGHN